MPVGETYLAGGSLNRRPPPRPPSFFGNVTHILPPPAAHPFFQNVIHAVAPRPAPPRPGFASALGSIARTVAPQAVAHQHAVQLAQQARQQHAAQQQRFFNAVSSVMQQARQRSLAAQASLGASRLISGTFGAQGMTYPQQAAYGAQTLSQGAFGRPQNQDFVDQLGSGISDAASAVGGAAGSVGDWLLHHSRGGAATGVGTTDPSGAFHNPNATGRAVQRTLNDPVGALNWLRRGGSGIQTAAATGPSAPGVASGLEKLLVETPKAFVANPGNVLLKTATGLGQMAIGAVPGTIQAIGDPVGAAQAMRSDIARRYGQSPEAYRKMVEQQGAAPELADVAMLTGVAGGVGGRLVGAAARRGGLGEAARAVMGERPRLQVHTDLSGENAAASVPQNRSANFFKAVGQQGQDVLRARRFQQRAGRAAQTRPGEAGAGVAGTIPTPARAAFTTRAPDLRLIDRGEQLIQRHGSVAAALKATHPDHGGSAADFAAVQAARKGIAPMVTQQISARPGTVAPMFLRNQRRMQRLSHGAIQSDAYANTRYAQQVEIHDFGKGAKGALAKLTVPQRRALVPVLKGMVRATGEVDPATGELAAVGDLGRWEKQVRDTFHAAGGVGEPPAVHDIEYLRQHAKDIFGPQLEHVRQQEAARVKRVDAGEGVNMKDLALKDLTKRHQAVRAQGFVLGVDHPHDAALERIEHERAANYAGGMSADQVEQRRLQQLDDLAQMREAHQQNHIDAVHAAAKETGLPEPVYVKDYPAHGQQVHGRLQWTMGGERARRIRESQLSLLSTGRAHMGPEAYLSSLAEQITRKANHAQIGEQIERHAVAPPPREELAQILGRQSHLNPNELTREDWNWIKAAKGMRHDDYAFWSPGAFNREVNRGHGEPGIGTHTGAGDRQAFGGVEPGTISALEHGLADGDVIRERGVKLIPAEVANGIRAGAAAGNRGVRFAGKVTRLQSMGMLGLNPGWPIAMTGASALQHLVGTLGDYKSLFQAPGVVRELRKDPEWAQWLHAHEIGQTTNDTGRFRMGAAAPGWMNGIRYRKDAAALRMQFLKNKVGLGNVPLGPAAMYRLDRAQRAVFKRGLLVTAAKREAFRRVTENMGTLAGLGERLRSAMSPGLTPETRSVLGDIPRDRATGERVGQTLRDVFGDWTRFTYKERQSLLRHMTLFYPFMRYALKTMFVTLPVKHPVVASVLAKLGQLHNDEVRSLIGGVDEAPWAYSHLFFRGGSPLSMLGLNDTPATGVDPNNVSSIDALRLNPMTTPLADMATGGVRALGGVISPAVQAALDQLYGEKLFSGKGFTVGSNPKPTTGSIAPADRTRIALGEMLGTLWPYRAAKAVTQPGKQADTSLLFAPSPLKYGPTSTTGARNAQAVAGFNPGVEALHQLLPQFVPMPDDTRSVVGALRAQHGGAPVPGAVSPLDRAIEHVLGPGAVGSSKLDSTIDRALKPPAGGSSLDSQIDKALKGY